MGVSASHRVVRHAIKSVAACSKDLIKNTVAFGSWDVGQYLDITVPGDGRAVTVPIFRTKQPATPHGIMVNCEFVFV